MSKRWTTSNKAVVGMRTYKFKIYQSKKNKHLVKQNYVCSHIYNHCIALHKRYYKMYGKYISLYQLQKHLTKMKKRKFHFWKEVGSQTIQEISERIDKGFKLFFKKNAKRPPSFKSKYKYKSFTMKKAGWSIISDNQIRISKQIYKFSKSRDIEGDIKLVTVKKIV